MPAAVTTRSAIAAINKLGATLVFPLDNRPAPVSLWSHFHPRTRMRWEWDAGGDGRVSTLWHLRAQLSCSGKVVYMKWLRGRATFFSLPVFSALVRLLAGEEELGLSEEARRLYQCFEERSPLSTKEAKEAAELRGRASAATYERALKELWARMLIVGFGEKDDGAFPSLMIGASKWMHEAAWREGRAMALEDARATIDRMLPEGNLFRRELDRMVAGRRPMRGAGK